MKLRIAALLFGIIFLAAGVAWHLPLFFDNDLLFGLFQINSFQNKLHIASGLIALAATSTTSLSRLYFKVFGSFYLLLGLFGFIFQEELLSMPLNKADNFLHLALGVLALLIGFKMRTPASE